MQVFTATLESGHKRDISTWELDLDNLEYVPKLESVTFIRDVSDGNEAKFHLTLSSGVERLITQHDIDEKCLRYCKYDEFVTQMCLADLS